MIRPYIRTTIWHIGLTGRIRSEERCEGACRTWHWMDYYDKGEKVACGIPEPSTATITFPSEEVRGYYL